MVRLFLVVGLPGAGKTTRARELAVIHSALRLTPDAWMIPLFDDSDANGKRDVLERRLVWTAVEALKAGADVVLDFGFWVGTNAHRCTGWPDRSASSARRCIWRSIGGRSGSGSGDGGNRPRTRPTG